MVDSFKFERNDIPKHFLVFGVPERYRIKLTKDFQKELFQNFIKLCKTRKETAKRIGTTTTSLRRYAQGISQTIPASVLREIAKTCGLERSKLDTFILEIESPESLRKRNRIEGLKKRAPKLKDVLLKTKGSIALDVAAWMEKSGYLKTLRTSGSGLVKNIREPKVTDKQITLEYEHRNQYRGYERKVQFLPRWIILDERLAHFIGLWKGDRTRSVGISNKNVQLLKTAVQTMIKGLMQPIESFKAEIFCNRTLSPEEIETHKRILITEVGVNEVRSRVKNGYSPLQVCYDIYVENGPLRCVLNFIENNIDNVLSMLDRKTRGAFYAGFFDAEGIVNSKQSRLELSQKDQRNIVLLEKWLRKDGFHPKLYVDRIVIPSRVGWLKNDFRLFKRMMFPYIKHSQKREEIVDVLKGSKIKKNHVLIVYWISKHPNYTAHEISAAFDHKKHTFQSEILKPLVDIEYLRVIGRGVTNDPFRYIISDKGSIWIKESPQFIEHLAEMIFRDGFIRGRMYAKEMPALQEITNTLATARRR